MCAGIITMAVYVLLTKEYWVSLVGASIAIVNVVLLLLIKTKHKKVKQSNTGV
jgi:hypothetical protein